MFKTGGVKGRLNKVKKTALLVFDGFPKDERFQCPEQILYEGGCLLKIHQSQYVARQGAEWGTSKPLITHGRDESWHAWEERTHCTNCLIRLRRRRPEIGLGTHPVPRWVGIWSDHCS